MSKTLEPIKQRKSVITKKMTPIVENNETWQAFSPPAMLDPAVVLQYSIFV